MLEDYIDGSWTEEWPKKPGWYWTFSAYPDEPPRLDTCEVRTAGSGNNLFTVYSQNGEFMFEEEAERREKIVWWKKIAEPIVDPSIERHIVTRYVRHRLAKYLMKKSFWYFQEEGHIDPEVERVVVPNLVPYGGFCFIHQDRFKELSVLGKKEMDGEFWMTTFQDDCLQNNYRIAVEKPGLFTVLRKK